ncbi:MAG: NAD(P)H-binding protein [Armatimonadota bacterium]|nr:NAD(P)H-binding protein [bacterium]
MSNPDLCAVTGANGFSGRSIARRLLSKGTRVLNLTGHPDRPHDLGDGVTSVSYNFDDPAALARSLHGVNVLYNNYWIRFAHGDMTFDKAVANSKTLIKAAEDAGVGRIVHVSIANPSEDSPLPYYKGKAAVEKAITSSNIPYAILRPAVLFGDQGILINNIAWFLRHVPVFGVPGSGQYKMQPIFVEDLADLAVEWGEKHENVIIDAVGPEAFSFNDWVHLIAQAVHSKTLIMHFPPSIALIATGIIGALVGDVILTPDEVAGLQANLLVSSHPPTAGTKLSDWLHDNADWIGTTYFSELKRHFAGS